MKKAVAFLLSILLLLSIVSCKSADKVELPPMPDPPVDIPEAPPSSNLSAELVDLWRHIDGSTATIPLTAALHEHFGSTGNPPVHNTTSEAYSSLIHGTDIQLIFVTHPSEEEFEAARQQGVELEIIPLVKDALVFLVNIDNPVDGISLSELQDIYSGAITDWNTLGGLNEAIIPYQRTQNSGSQTLLMKLVMGDREPMAAPTGWIAESMGMLIEVISDYDNARDAIGYSVFYYVNNMYGNSQFKLLEIDGVKPSRETIMRGEYPLEDNYYAVIRKDTPQEHPARKLIDWILTDEGQLLAAQAGYIPLRPMENVWSDDSIDPIYLGDIDNSSGTGGTELKDSVDGIQPINGVRPPLSDIFYDGFNYIQYINSEILMKFDWIDIEAWDQISWGEISLIRPFTGIPNDYPNYEVNYMGFLFIHFSENNPFFKHAVNFQIPLTTDISPYGIGLSDYSVIYDYAGRILQNVDLFTLQVNLRDKPAVSDRINEQIKTWVETFPDYEEQMALLMDFARWYKGILITDPNDTNVWYRLQPTLGFWQDYLSVNYVLQTYDGPSGNLPMLFTICFDINTGEIVQLTDKIANGVDYTDAFVFTRMNFKDVGVGDYPNQEHFSDYTPITGTVITDAWITYDRLSVYLVEPDGRVLQAILS